jgi:hypothetical protein
MSQETFMDVRVKCVGIWGLSTVILISLLHHRLSGYCVSLKQHLRL